MTAIFRIRFQRLVAGMLIPIVLLLSFSPVLPVKRASALPLPIPKITFTHELPGPLLGGQIATAGASAATAVSSGGQFVISNILNGIAWMVAKVAIQSITRSIVNWINNGYQGSPAFSTNLGNDLRKAADTYAGSFLTKLANDEAIKSPFIDQVAQAAGAAYYINSNKDAFRQQLIYNLNQVTARDQAFLSGDFQSGGFDAWMAAISNPSNNAFGAQMLVGRNLAADTADSITRTVTELAWNRGLFSWRGSCAYAQNSSSGKIKATNLNLSDGTSIKSSLSDNDKCIQYNIDTPGSVIDGKLQQVFGTDIRQLEIADSINEIVGAVVTHMVTSALGGGGLRGLSQPAAGGGAAPIDASTDPSAYTSNSNLLAQGFASDISTKQQQIDTFKTNWQKILDAANAAQQAVTGSLCVPNSQTVISSQIQPVIDKANAALTKAASAQKELDTLKQSVDAAQNASGSNQATLWDSAMKTYQSSPNTLTQTDIGASTSESVDTSNADNTGTTPSLYTQMILLTQQAQCQTSV
jgi:hypothetical protein